jgi:hypothetical protein
VGKGGRWVGLTTLLPSCADCLKIWEPLPPEPSRPVMGLLYLYPLNRRLDINSLVKGWPIGVRAEMPIGLSGLRYWSVAAAPPC